MAGLTGWRNTCGPLGWARWANDGVPIHRLPGGCLDLVKPPIVDDLAARLQACIDGAGGN